jgi:hypothetical protein
MDYEWEKRKATWSGVHPCKQCCVQMAFSVEKAICTQHCLADLIQRISAPRSASVPTPYRVVNDRERADH